MSKQQNKNLQIWLIEKSEKIFSSQRFLLRKIFLSLGSAFNIGATISLLPFILGFSHFINQKYPGEKKVLFFSQNLPVFSVPIERINWDTFSYLIKRQDVIREVFKNAEIFQIDDNFYIKTHKNNSLFHPSENQLIGYKKINPTSKLIKNNWQKFLFKPLSYAQQAYLDEIPMTMESRFPENFDAPNSFIDGSYIPVDFLSQLETTHSFYKKETIETFRKNRTFSFSSLGSETSFQKLTALQLGIKSPLTLSSQHKNLDFDFFDQDYFDDENFLENTSILFSQEEAEKIEIFFNKEVTSLFFEQEIPFEFGLFTLTPDILLKFQDNSSSIDEDKFFLQCLDQLHQDKSFFSSLRTRYMSGHLYPDMTTTEILTDLFFSSKNLTKYIEINLPTSCSGFLPSHFHYSQNPEVQIKAKYIKLDGIYDEKYETLYYGPGFFFDPQNGLDWVFSDLSSARTWLLQYFSDKNPFSDVFQVFTGLDYEDSNLNPHSSVVDFNYWKKFLSVYKKQSFSTRTKNFFSDQNLLQFPSDIQTKKLNVDFKYIPLPFFEAKKSSDEPIGLDFSTKNSLDFEYILPINTIDNDTSLTNFSRKFLTQSHLNTKDYLENYLIPGLYQKIPSIFHTKETARFNKSWEPINFNAWLISSQIGFAYIVFRILKSLADNYGKELLIYLLDLVALLGFLNEELKQEIEILMGQREKGFRIIRETSQNFQNIAGMHSILPEIIEIVWFLRNQGRSFSISKTLPRGILLTGPPGTGKTLLVQAIAGEANVPVLTLSGSSLLEPGESGAVKLELLFDEARKLAPCIVFIDEMDTLAEKRENMLLNTLAEENFLDYLQNNEGIEGLVEEFSLREAENESEFTNELYIRQGIQKEKLRILLQFLVELDGMQSRDGVVVIGATNRPEMLDPAALRPGRLEKTIEIGLPGPEKRLELFKLYSENLSSKNIPWDYFVHRTAGYSAADIASMMNQSALHAILKNTVHTLESIEYGIDRITTIGLEKTSKKQKLTSSTIQFAYYQAGKVLISSLLIHLPATLIIHLWPRKLNARAMQIYENLQNEIFTFGQRIELEHRLIGCYAGKAAEIIFLEDLKEDGSLSDFGSEDLLFGQKVIRLMIEKGHLYGKKDLIQKHAEILTNFNIKEYQKQTERLPFFQSLVRSVDSTTLKPLDLKYNREIGLKKEKEVIEETEYWQEYSQTAIWQSQISDTFEFSTRDFSNWYRIYLPDPKQIEQNLEWIPPDQFYHANEMLKELSSFGGINWNTLSGMKIDYKTHSLILQSFNRALSLLDNYREVLDKLVYELLIHEVLREPEIEKILEKFDLTLKKDKKKQITFSALTKTDQLKIVEPSWGLNSRRSIPHLIDLNAIQRSKNQEPKPEE